MGTHTGQIVQVTDVSLFSTHACIHTQDENTTLQTLAHSHTCVQTHKLAHSHTNIHIHTHAHMYTCGCEGVVGKKRACDGTDVNAAIPARGLHAAGSVPVCVRVCVHVCVCV